MPKSPLKRRLEEAPLDSGLAAPLAGEASSPLYNRRGFCLVIIFAIPIWSVIL